MTELKFTSAIFYNFVFIIYMNMSKNSSVKYYQKNKGGLQNKARERYQTLSKEEEEEKKKATK